MSGFLVVFVYSKDSYCLFMESFRKFWHTSVRISPSIFKTEMRLMDFKFKQFSLVCERGISRLVSVRKWFCWCEVKSQSMPIAFHASTNILSLHIRREFLPKLLDSLFFHGRKHFSGRKRPETRSDGVWFLRRGNRATTT